MTDYRTSYVDGSADWRIPNAAAEEDAVAAVVVVAAAAAEKDAVAAAAAPAVVAAGVAGAAEVNAVPAEVDAAVDDSRKNREVVSVWGS